MPVTHGVTGSSPVRTAKSLSVMLRGLFVYIQQVKKNPLKYRFLHLQSILTKNDNLLDICGQTRTETDKMRYQFALPDPQMRYQFKVLYKLKAKCIREIAVIQNGSSNKLLP